jgi:hypothetical protein
MADLFVIPSAIHTSYSAFDAATRFQQTLQTVSSIRRRLPLSLIYLIDVGQQDLDPGAIESLMKLRCSVACLAKTSMVQQFYQLSDPKGQWIKTPGELWAMIYFLSHMHQIQSTDRIFKISGRYQLSNEFDRTLHDHAGRLVISRPRPAVIYFDPQGNQHIPPEKYQYSTRLYSFCGSLMSTMTETFGEMFDRVIKSYGEMKFVDAEHMMYAQCHMLDPIELPWLGVIGQQGPDAIWVTE